MRRPRLAATLISLILASCAAPQGGAVIGVRSPPLGEGGFLVDDVGVIVPSEGFAPILTRGCELPCKGSFSLRTSSEDQESFRVRLLRRSSRQRGAVSRLIDFEVIEIPPGSAGERRVEVTLRAKKDQLSLFASEEETGTPLTIRTILFVGE